MSKFTQKPFHFILRYCMEIIRHCFFHSNDCAMKLSIITLSIMTISITTFSKMTLSLMHNNYETLLITSVKCFIVYVFSIFLRWIPHFTISEPIFRMKKKLFLLQKKQEGLYHGWSKAIRRMATEIISHQLKSPYSKLFFLWNAAVGETNPDCL